MVLRSIWIKRGSNGISIFLELNGKKNHMVTHKIFNSIEELIENLDDLIRKEYPDHIGNPERDYQDVFLA